MFRKIEVFTMFVLLLVFEQSSGVALDGDCTSGTCTDAHTECTGTGTKTCTCVSGYTKQGTECKADLGTSCTATADCDTTTTSTAVCDVLAEPKVCKIKSTGDCTGKTDKCISNAVCTNNACVCSAKYKENTAKLCATVLGSTCTATADCSTAVANSDCTGSGSKTCTCNNFYTRQGADCKADLGTACTATTDCDTVTTTAAVCDLNAATKICSVGSGGDCSGSKSTKCITQSTCTINVCTCATGYAATTSKLCSGAEGLMKMMTLSLMLTSLFAVFVF